MYKFLFHHSFSFFWDKCPEVQMLGCMIHGCLALLEIPKVFYRVAIPFAIPVMYKRSSLYAQRHLLFSLSFFLYHSVKYVIIIHCGFNSHSLMTTEVQHLFMCLLAIHISSLVKCLFMSFVHFQLDGFFIDFV